MKNHKKLNGFAYMFLGAALLVSGPRVQEQIDRLASDPDLQLAKAMYQSMVYKAVAQAKTEVLADNHHAVPMVDFAEAPTRVMVKTAAVEVTAPAVKVEVAVAPLPKFITPTHRSFIFKTQRVRMIPPTPRVELGAIRGMTQVEIALLKTQAEKAHVDALATLHRIPEIRRAALAEAETKAKDCTESEIETEL
jgi:hypothetical protein